MSDPSNCSHTYFEPENNVITCDKVEPADIGIESDSSYEMGNEDQPCSSSGSSNNVPDRDALMAIAAEYDGVHAVVPLKSCPHLEQVAELPKIGIDAKQKCSECGIGAEVWTCLTCYQASCGRFVNEHALMHHLSSSHPMSLSLADLSVWCYPCESYVHNPVLIPAKSSAHESKFGEKMPH